jgi:CHAD domain-containing protein
VVGNRPRTHISTISYQPHLSDLAFGVVREQFALLRSHEAGTRAGDDPEELHDMRVATRRLRAALRCFQDVLPASATVLNEELGWLANGLAAVRDLDVQLLRVQDLATIVSEQEQASLAAVRDVLNADRDQARTALIALLDSERYTALLRLAFDLLGEVVADRTDPTVADAAGAVLTRPFQSLRKAGDRLTSDSPPAEFHALRKRAKRLRYTLEFVANEDSPEARRFLRRLVVLQDLLGEHQDAEVAVAHLRALAERVAAPPSVLFAMGELAQRRSVEAVQLRAQFESAYRPVVGKEWRKLHRQLGGPPEATPTEAAPQNAPEV